MAIYDLSATYDWSKIETWETLVITYLSLRGFWAGHATIYHKVCLCVILITSTSLFWERLRISFGGVYSCNPHARALVAESWRMRTEDALIVLVRLLLVLHDCFYLLLQQKNNFTLRCPQINLRAAPTVSETRTRKLFCTFLICFSGWQFFELYGDWFYVDAFIMKSFGS